MRRIKQVSITKYITIYLIVFVVSISFFMAIFVSVLADRMIHYDIQSTMIKKVVGNGKHVNYVDGELKPDSEYKFEDDGMYFQILDEEGKILLGKSPKGFDVPGEIGKQKLHILQENGKDYYIIDRVNRRLTKATEKIIYSRGIVEKENIDSKYQIIKYISYGSIPVFILIVLLGSFVLSKNISDPLTQMSKTAEMIGKEGELSKRMEYGGKIKEFSILADTNNHMLERVENMFDTQKRFSSDVAHELRTPLAVLLAQCEYAKEHTETKEEFDASIDVIYRQAVKSKATGKRAVETGACGRGKKVRAFQPFKECCASLPGNLLTKNRKKLLFCLLMIHNALSPFLYLFRAAYKAGFRTIRSGKGRTLCHER